MDKKSINSAFIAKNPNQSLKNFSLENNPQNKNISNSQDQLKNSTLNPQNTERNNFLIFEISDKSKTEEYKKINLLLNNEKNFVKFSKTLTENSKILFLFEKPEKYLLDYLRSEKLNIFLRLYLFKQSIEIIQLLKEYSENFDFFSHNLFYVETEKNSSNSHPILKILYHSNLFLFNFLGEIKHFGFKSQLLAKSEFYWLFYLYQYIFMEYSNINQLNQLIEFDSTISAEMNSIYFFLKSKIDSNDNNLNFIDFIEYVNIVLERKNISKINTSINTKYNVNPNNNINNKPNLNNFELLANENNSILEKIYSHLSNGIVNLEKEKRPFSDLVNLNNCISKDFDKDQLNQIINFNGDYNNINIKSDNIFNLANNSEKNKTDYINNFNNLQYKIPNLAFGYQNFTNFENLIPQQFLFQNNPTLPNNISNRNINNNLVNCLNDLIKNNSNTRNQINYSGSSLNLKNNNGISLNLNAENNNLKNNIFNQQINKQNNFAENNKDLKLNDFFELTKNNLDNISRRLAVNNNFSNNTSENPAPLSSPGISSKNILTETKDIMNFLSGKLNNSPFISKNSNNLGDINNTFDLLNKNKLTNDKNNLQFNSVNLNNITQLSSESNKLTVDDSKRQILGIDKKDCSFLDLFSNNNFLSNPGKNDINNNLIPNLNVNSNTNPFSLDSFFNKLNILNNNQNNFLNNKNNDLFFNSIYPNNKILSDNSFNLFKDFSNLVNKDGTILKNETNKFNIFNNNQNDSINKNILKNNNDPMDKNNTNNNFNNISNFGLFQKISENNIKENSTSNSPNLLDKEFFSPHILNEISSFINSPTNLNKMNNINNKTNKFINYTNQEKEILKNNFNENLIPEFKNENINSEFNKQSCGKISSSESGKLTDIKYDSNINKNQKEQNLHNQKILAYTEQFKNIMNFTNENIEDLNNNIASKQKNSYDFSNKNKIYSEIKDYNNFIQNKNDFSNHNKKSFKFNEDDNIICEEINSNKKFSKEINTRNINISENIINNAKKSYLNEENKFIQNINLSILKENIPKNNIMSTNLDFKKDEFKKISLENNNNNIKSGLDKQEIFDNPIKEFESTTRNEIDFNSQIEKNLANINRNLRKRSSHKNKTSISKKLKKNYSIKLEKNSIKSEQKKECDLSEVSSFNDINISENFTTNILDKDTKFSKPFNISKNLKNKNKKNTEDSFNLSLDGDNEYNNESNLPSMLLETNENYIIFCKKILNFYETQNKNNRKKSFLKNKRKSENINKYFSYSDKILVSSEKDNNNLSNIYSECDPSGSEINISSSTKKRIKLTRLNKKENIKNSSSSHYNSNKQPKSINKLSEPDDYYFHNNYSNKQKNSFTSASFTKNDLDLIDKVNFPRRKKLKVSNNDIRNEMSEAKGIMTKNNISNYAEIFPIELEEVLKNERHVFMKNHFRNMYNLKNFYLYIKLNIDRRLKIKEHVVDLYNYPLQDDFDKKNSFQEKDENNFVNLNENIINNIVNINDLGKDSKINFYQEFENQQENLEYSNKIIKKLDFDLNFYNENYINSNNYEKSDSFFISQNIIENNTSIDNKIEIENKMSIDSIDYFITNNKTNKDDEYFINDEKNSDTNFKENNHSPINIVYKPDKGKISMEIHSVIENGNNLSLKNFTDCSKNLEGKNLEISNKNLIQEDIYNDLLNSDNKYVSIKTDLNENKDEIVYIIEIDKNVLLEETKFLNIEKSEQELLDKIIPNLKIEKVWNPYIFSSEQSKYIFFKFKN